MRYISTRGDTPAMSFQDAVLTGLAPDGGLLIPERIPDLSQEVEALRGADFVSLAAAIVAHFIDDIAPADQRRLLQDAYASFAHSDIAPLVDVGEVSVLELFHGPTLAFKDVALQLLGQLFDHTLSDRGGRLNVLAATSGDTGSAAIAGVQGKSNVNIAVMFPYGRISPLQELQMTTVADSNVHCLAVHGSFDDCQTLMKQTFADVDFKAEHQLGAVNSVNWARVLAQTVYYAYASLARDAGDGVDIAVPTGNFGNIFAGYIARRMGFPIARLLLGTNENDILAGVFKSGAYRRGDVHQTLSPSMDIQVASNFERLVYYVEEGSTHRVKDFMATFQRDGAATLQFDQVREQNIEARAIDTRTTLETIADTYRQHGYVLDPHSAVGVATALQLRGERPLVAVATAHPAKFPDAVQRALPDVSVTHPTLEALRDLPQRVVELPATERAIRGYIETHVA